MADEIPTEALEAAARALAETHCQRSVPPWMEVGSPWDNPPVPPSAVQRWRQQFLDEARHALAAAAPYLIAEGRRQAAEAIRAQPEKEAQLQSLGLWRALGDRLFTDAARWFAQIAEGLTPAERAERQLRESRERQAGLDMDRIERRARIAESPTEGGG
jgi:hypothetical protein